MSKTEEIEGDAASTSKSRWKTSWNPVRLSGRLKFRKKSSTTTAVTTKGSKAIKAATKKPLKFEDSFLDPLALKSPPLYGHQPEEPKKSCSGCGYQFRAYCEYTSLHGFRYITEKHRNLSERYVNI